MIFARALGCSANKLFSPLNRNFQFHRQWQIIWHPKIKQYNSDAMTVNSSTTFSHLFHNLNRWKHYFKWRKIILKNGEIANRFKRVKRISPHFVVSHREREKRNKLSTTFHCNHDWYLSKDYWVKFGWVSGVFLFAFFSHLTFVSLCLLWSLAPLANYSLSWLVRTVVRWENILAVVPFRFGG